MTTCPRCGLINRVGTLACPQCGLSLMPANAIPPDVQPEWMRSLQTNQPYTSNGSGQAQQQYPQNTGGAPGYGAAQPGTRNPQRVSMNSLVNEDSLPEWLRNAANSGVLPPMTPPAGPAQNSGPLMGTGWESAHPPVTSSPVGSGSLGTNNLFDESALPEWLRRGAIGQGPDLPTESLQVPSSQGGYGAPGPTVGPKGQGPAAQDSMPYPTSAFPSIERAGSFQTSAPRQSGMPAPSLIDTNALPQWLSGRSEAAAPSTYGRDDSRGIPGGSLVDEHALPQWLRNEQPGPANQNAASVWNAPQSGNEPMPSWLSQGYVDTPRMDSPTAQPSAWNSYLTGGAVGQPLLPSESSGHGTLAAGEFVDESALPEWLRSQGGTANLTSPGAPPLPPSIAPTGTATFSASDLIDPSALPAWVRGSEAGPAATFSSTSGWSTRQPVPEIPRTTGQDQPLSRSNGLQPTPNTRGSVTSNGPEAAYGSPIPRNELPSWLMNNAPPPVAARGPAAPSALQRPTPAERQNRAGDMSEFSMSSASWDDGPREKTRDYDDYDDYTGYDDDSRTQAKRDQREPRSGWRRFFNRK